MQSGTGGQGTQSPTDPPKPIPASPTPTNPDTSPSAGSPTPKAPPPAGAAHGHGPYGSASTTGSSTVALSFDDGPGGNTAQVLDLLDQYGIKATFCLIGKQVPANAALVKRIVADGHTLCNHTWDHDEQLRTRSPAVIHTELQKTNDAIHAVVPDAPIKYFRNPGGNFSPQTMSIAASMGMSSIYWDVDPRDWSRPGVQSITSNVIGHTRAGSIVLMHDGGGDRSQTVTALRTILPNLKSRFTLIPLPT
jgi:peptidoglycan/xylan/chitin deacetylase (PgdA/CDA1 family)